VRDAAAVAAELDRWWDDQGRPDPFVVVEDGADDGRVAAALLAVGLRCAPALRYLLVEPDPRRWTVQRGRVPLEPPAELLGPVLAGTAEGDDAVPLPGMGPLFASLAELPRGLDLAVVFRLGRPPAGARAWLDAARRVAVDGLAVVIAADAVDGAGWTERPGVPAARWRHALGGSSHLEVVAWALGWVDREG
jgi:hypothetical protein